MLKKLMLGVALTTLIAAPALAAPRHGAYDRDADGVHPQMAQAWSRGTRAYAYMPETTGAISRSDKVYVNGKYVGQDPDPNVRLELSQGNPLWY